MNTPPCHEPAGGGQLSARIPALPGTISSEPTKAEARRNVLDALGVMLSVEPEAIPAAAATERVSLTVNLERETGRAIAWTSAREVRGTGARQEARP